MREITSKDRLATWMVENGFEVEYKDGKATATINTARGEVTTFFGHPFTSSVYYSMRIDKPNGSSKWYFEKTDAQIICTLKKIIAAN